jgi:catechol 2,3-dioxygenase-like lactoylglutathione lyase family enzyme
MKAIRHSGIVVSDLDASLKFYRDLLGFKATKTLQEKGPYLNNILVLKEAAVTTVKMAADDGNQIELLFFGPDTKPAPNKKLDEVGLTHLAFTVSDLDSLYSRLVAEGVVFNSAPQLSPDGYAKVAFCQDPDGVFLELVEVVR